MRQIIAAGALALLAGGAAAAHPAPPERLTGVRFSLDTVELPAPARGALGLFVGTVELAAGRGRLDVTARRAAPALAIQGVTVAAPLAGPGDYYLFDDTGFVLVRPATRTFSTFALSEFSYRHGDVREERKGFMEFARLRADTIAAGDAARRAQHGAYTVRWHLDRRRADGPAQVLARGWIELPDAPGGEASVVRWFGAAAALATMPGGVGALPPDSLQVTAAVVFPAPGGGAGERRTPLTLIVLHPLSGVATVEVEPARLVLPAGFTETPWPGFEGAAVRPPLSADRGARWRALPAAPRR